MVGDAQAPEGDVSFVQVPESSADVKLGEGIVGVVNRRDLFREPEPRCPQCLKNMPGPTGKGRPRRFCSETCRHQAKNARDRRDTERRRKLREAADRRRKA